MSFINMAKDKCNKTKYFAVGAVLMTVFFVLTPFRYALMTGAESAVNGLNQAARTGYLGEGNPSEKDITETSVLTDLPTAIGKMIGAVLSFVGVVFLILMIYAGFIWMFARGNDQEVARAKTLIEAAIIGLVIVLAAYAITKFVGDQLM